MSSMTIQCREVHYLGCYRYEETKGDSNVSVNLIKCKPTKAASIHITVFNIIQ